MKVSRDELASMLRLALPVVIAELGWVSMSIVDTMMVGRLGAEAIGAVSIGSSLFIAAAIFGIGILLGLDTFISQAFGADNQPECRRWLAHGVYLSLLLTPPLTGAAMLPTLFMESWGTRPEVLVLAIPYLKTLALSVLPLLLYATFRRYLQALSKVGFVMLTLITANVVNAVANWVLIFGNLGFPALGVEGAGWATFVSRAYMAVTLFAFILYTERHRLRAFIHEFTHLEKQRLKDLIGLGFPAAIQLTLEIGVFATATAFASRLAPVALAAHQVALATAAFTFMVPLGVSAAGAVRVGQAMGRGEPRQAADSGWTALVVGTAFMAFAALMFLIFPVQILRLYTPEATVISVGVPLLAIAAFFQVFDGLQVISTGILRGTGETRTAMKASLVCHWFLGLPIGYVLCFVLDWGVFGLWIGLSTGLTVVAIWLVSFWSFRIREIS
jgi:MATE family multidrug resistance protein